MVRVTPYTLTSAALDKNPDLMLQFRENPKIGNPGDYEARQAIDLAPEQTTGLEASTLADIAWATYQNIDEDRMTPDNGRSMMVGDLVKVEIDDAKPVWMVTASMGFKDVTDQVAGRDMAAKQEPALSNDDLQRRRQAYQGFASAAFARPPGR